MKKLTALIIFLVLLFLVYTGYWFYQAHRLKEIARYHLNEYEKPNQEGYFVKVDDVSVTGFPFQYVIKFHNPKYKKEAGKEGVQADFKMALDGNFKIGTDIFGKSYWFKQDGDIHYLPVKNPTEEDQENQAKKYVIKGNLELKVDVAHPQYGQAFLHPFRGLPKAFYKENPTFQEVLDEIKMASYEDSQFGMYEVGAEGQKKLVGFSNGWVRWENNPQGKEDEKFVFSMDVKDFEAAENGKPLLPHLKKLMDLNTDMAVDVPYLLGSGKNNFSLELEALFPRNFDIDKFFSYKNIELILKKLEMDNLYGHTVINFDVNLKEHEKEARKLHFGFNTESKITEKGSEAIHRQFIDGIKLQVAAQPDDPENKVLKDILQCCEDRLQDVIPDYTKLGKMQFIIDADAFLKEVNGNPSLNKILLNHLNAITEPYAIRTHGIAEFTDAQPHGKYEIQWDNYKQMIHDAVAYFNRIHPLLEKFAESNQQPFPLGLIDDVKEKEIEDFFRSIANDSSKDGSSLTITIDFTDPSNPKIGHNTIEQVKQAWEKLVEDLMKPEPSKVKAPAESETKNPVDSETKASEKVEEPVKVS